MAGFMRMVTYRVKKVVAWVLAITIIVLIFAGVAFVVMHV